MASNQGKGENRSEKSTSNRGFAAMDPEMQKAIASKGGQAAHQQGRAHEFTPEEAREAGRKGGEAVSQNREHMAAIGRKGGQSRGNRENRETRDVSNRENGSNRESTGRENMSSENDRLSEE